MRYSFDDPAAEERRPTQYFEMVGNRGIYHEGWTAVTRHGVPWKMTEEPRPFDRDTWELYDVRADWSQAHDLAADDPERLARLQALFDEEAEKHQVLPLDDRVTERENPELAGRYDLRHGRLRMVLGRHTGRLSEEAAPNVKNRSHRITVDLDIPADHPPQSTNGVLVAQGGRFGGWSFYVVSGRPHYAYNRYGKDLVVVRADSVLWPGEHEVVAGLPLRRGATRQRRRGHDPARRWCGGRGIGSRRPRRTTSPSTSRSTSASTAAARSSTTTRRCATPSPARSAGSSSTSTTAPRSTPRPGRWLASRAHD